jgi:hypothetical protein
VSAATLAPLVRVMVVLEPWSVTDWVVDPTVRGPLGVRLLVLMAAKVGLAVVAMSWMVFTTPETAEKLVELKAAMPLVAPSAAALSMVMVLPPVVALATVSAPVRVLRLDTPATLAQLPALVQMS